MKFYLPKKIPIRFRCYEANLLVGYLNYRSAKETTGYLRGFLHHCAQSICNDVEPAVSKIKFEHDAEQTEALLGDLLKGIEPEP